MNKEQFYKLPTRKKVGYVFSKVGVFAATIGAGIGAVFASGLQLVTTGDQLNFTLGGIMIMALAVLAGIGRLKDVIRIKSIGWILAFIFLWVFNSMGHFLVWGVGLTAIPLVIDDVIVNPLWMNWVVNNEE